MEIAAIVSGRGVLVGYEGGELTGPVVGLCGRDDVCPRILGDVVQHFRIDIARCHAGQCVWQKRTESVDPLGQALEILIAADVQIMQVLHVRLLGKFRTCVGGCLDRTEKHGVVGDGVEVQRFRQFDFKAGRMSDSRPLGITVSIVGGGDRTERIGVE